MSTLKKRVTKLMASICEACENSDRDPTQVELLPVSKHQSLMLIHEAKALGFTKFGENYVQESVKKHNFDNTIKFVLIGPLQSNKAKQAVMTFHEIMTVDRPTLAERLEKITEQLDLVCPIWIQVNMWNESTKKSGCNFSEVQTIVNKLNGNMRLPIQGFMAIPPVLDTKAFSSMANLRNLWQQKLGHGLRLSMGMSTDFKQAIKYGSDQIRVGTAFFGVRY